VGSKICCAGTTVIDKLIGFGEWILPKLIVPEINAEVTAADKIIANPNCSPFKWFWF
jgi:aspartate-semialdehyde dehydrogenase